MLDIDERVAGHTRAQCQCLLGQTTLGAQRSEPPADLLTAKFPRGDAVRIVLTGTRGHRTK